MQMFEADTLTAAQCERWRAFLESGPSSHYTQDPAWIGVQVHSSSRRRRKPWLTWVEEGGEVVLVGAGLKQASPIPGLSYINFGNGPAFSDVAVFNDWLAWVGRRAAARGVFIRVSPWWELSRGGDVVEACLAKARYHRDREIGTVATVMVDLAPPIGDIMRSLRRQTRQQINRTLEAGVTVEPENNAAGRSAFCDLFAELAARNGLIPLQVQDLAALDKFWFSDGPGGSLLLARLDGEAIAGGLVLSHGDTAYYTTAASTRTTGALGTSHAVVWTAISWAKEHGCTRLDLCGYSLQASPGDSLHGVNQFKQGFAPKTEPIKFCAMHELKIHPLTTDILRKARHFKRNRSTGSRRR
jgi:lipid II:glycine glycyltransferase (peptidoglycan interpeptide bridge formation enzyme)